MTISGAILGLPKGTAGWRLLQTKQPADFAAFSKDPTLKSDIAYLRAKLPTKLTAKSLLADPRLQKIVLSAYRLDAQVGMNGLMEKVLNSDVTSSASLAVKMSNAIYKQIATDFNYGGIAVPAIPAVPSTAKVAIEGLNVQKTIARFSGSFGGVTVREVDTSEATSPKELAATLQAALRTADGYRGDISVKVFGDSLVFTDAKGRGAAKNFTFGAVTGATGSLVTDSAVSAGLLGQPSKAKVTVNGLKEGQTIGNFSGTFGGITLTAVDTSGATFRPKLAAELQAAFRKADGGRSDISVTANGSELIFTDAKARGGAKAFSFDTPPGGGATASLTETTVDTGGVLAPAVLPTPSVASLAVNGFQPGQALNSFSGTFGGVTLKAVNTSAATNWKELAATLQSAFRAAAGGRADISVTAYGHSLTFTDSQGKGGASGFKLDTSGGATATLTGTTPATVTPTVDSTATLAISGLGVGQTIGSIVGTYAGVTPPEIDTSAITTVADLATALQTAFRTADKGATDISVTASGNTLVFADVRKRGGAASFSFEQPNGPTATLISTTSGNPPTAATGGPQVTSSSFVDQLVTRYTQAQFEQSVGDMSQSLRRALYAKTALPKVTNWYSVIADQNLGAVVRSTLDLPDSFGSVPVDQQVTLLKSRMNIADFKNPAKLQKLLDTYVAKASATETSTVNDPSGLLSLVQPIDLSGGNGSTSDSFSGASSAALFALL